MRFRPVIRVFVSSTFSDLKAERNILQSKVFPSLERYCMLRGFQFQVIDLRWGVPGEAGLDHRTMQICFDELRRVQEVSPAAWRALWLAALAERSPGPNFRSWEATEHLDVRGSRGKLTSENADSGSLVAPGSQRGATRICSALVQRAAFRVARRLWTSRRSARLTLVLRAPDGSR
jgi:hypothetical protein